MWRTLSYLLVSTVLFAQNSPPYRVAPVAGSDWVGDAGPPQQALLFQAEGLAADLAGNVYIADAAGHRVRQITPAGLIRTIAGTGRAGSSGDGGPATQAQLNSPYGLALSPTGTLYIADLGNGRVRQVDPDGTISTLVGGGALLSPRNLALDSAGNLYISDFGAHTVYRLNPAGALDRVAGTGIAGFSGQAAVATLAMLSSPTAIAVDRQNALYIADSQNHLIRKVAGGLIQTVGQAATPTGLAFDSFGTLYVADASAGKVLRFPVAGQAPPLALAARDLAFGPGGVLYATDGALVRRLQPNGTLSVLAGGGNAAHGDFGPALEARLNHPTAVAADAAGNLYIADRDNQRVRKVLPDGTILTVAGSGMAGDSGDGGMATRAALNTPVAVAADSAGNLFIADQGNHRVRMVTPGGVILPVARTILPSGLAVDTAGHVYIADQGAGRIYRADTGGGVLSVIGGLASPAGLAIDADGNLYFTEPEAGRVNKLTPDGVVVPVGAGLWSEPRGVAVSPSGDVFVADTGAGRLLRVSPAGAVSPLEMQGTLGAPWGIASGPDSVLYVAEAGENRIQSLTPQAAADPVVAIEVLNAASLRPGPVAPGMLVTIRGVRLERPQVNFNGITAVVLAARENELVVQAPAQIAGLDAATVEILDNGEPRATVPVPVAAAAPALFTNGGGLALAANEDGSLNAAAHPAPRGSVIVLYGTGQGAGDLPSTVRIGGYDAEVLYAGPVAGYPGLVQLNVRIPAGYIAPGTLTVVWSIGGAASQSGVAIAVE